MSKAQGWTAGPWEVVEIAHGETPLKKRQVYRVEIHAPQFYFATRTRSHSRHIAQIVDYAKWTDQPANARLIAAAPELYEALREATHWLRGTGKTAAESGCTCETLHDAEKKIFAALAKAEGDGGGK